MKLVQHFAIAFNLINEPDCGEIMPHTFCTEYKDIENVFQLALLYGSSDTEFTLLGIAGLEIGVVQKGIGKK